MRKFISLVFVLMLVFFLAAPAFALNDHKTAIGSVNAATPNVLLLSGNYTVVGVQVLYNSISGTASAALNKRFYLCDATSATVVAAGTVPAKVTLVAVAVSDAGPGKSYYTLGAMGSAPNGAVGLLMGVPFTYGVVLSGGTDGDGTSSVTITAAAIGYKGK